MEYLMSNNTLFIGLGVMGYHMASHLSKEVPTSIYNRSPDKADAWLRDFNGTHQNTLTTSLKNFDFIITCIGNDHDLRDIYLSDNGLLNQCTAGTILIDHTTASAGIAREIAEKALKKDLYFIDAPVSGGEQGAINGQLTIMCGGEDNAFNQAKPIMSYYAKAVTLLGQNGAGQLTKMANQLAVAGVVQGLAEAIHFAEQAGLDCHQVIDVISKGAAQSWQMENRSNTMIKGEYDHGFAVDLMRKDLDICLSEGRKIGAKLPVTALIDQFYADVQGMGGSRWDTSSLLERLRSKTN
ncbi:MAG: 3-hydroxyisobutyrate dehydrogenase-like beta-hydroxyacid dehydrogenase [Oleiphilaceae bacterium]|jgi:3-hydroxyisobutyrate dehydrogenase-like beta-hydroxyacid dehydrogenase